MSAPKAQQPVESVSQAAARLGVEFNAQDARQWMMAVAAGGRDGPLVDYAQSGIYASRIAMADFNPADLIYFRQLAQRVRVVRRPNVETAIAIAGSSAQGKVQVFPGDADFFERVNIKSPDRAGAQ